MSQHYEESDLLRALRQKLADHTGKKPGGYDPSWQEALDEVVSQILSREDFQYDASLDPLFQQYQDRYGNLGQRAMMDTLGKTAALTGGYGNSYAQLAGQQAYDSQLQGLYDRVPELYNLALERYKLQGDALSGRYDLLSGLEKGEYDRYRDSLSQWQSERDYLTGRVDAQQEQDYGAHRDAVKDSQWQQEFDEKLRQFNFKNKLGEFAPTPVPGGGGGGGRGGRGKKPAQEPEDSVTKPEKKRTKTNSALRQKQ